VHGRLAHRITSVDRAVFMLGVERVSSIAAQQATA
jgi:HD-like signal output (HDOD) protein